MEDIELPQYFICPISLQIMKDPVTILTGITYDRESIEHWLFYARKSTCPVTKQPLPKGYLDLTPNHTLRRLIQSWSKAHGVDQIPSPKRCLERSDFEKLIDDFENHPGSRIRILKQLESLALQSERNRRHLAAVGVTKAMLLYVVTCYKEEQTIGLQEALNILGISSCESMVPLVDIDQVIRALTWLLGCDNVENHVVVKSNAMLVLKILIEELSTSDSSVLERLKPELFNAINVHVLKGKNMKQVGINAALHGLLLTCPWGRNRAMMVESGLVHELIEILLQAPENRTTELVLGVLYHLCSSAGGRAQFLSHKGGIAVVAKRILRVSPAADDRAVSILSSICRFSGTSLVLQEMLNVNAVSKLCVLIQSDCGSYLKDKAREMLRSYSYEWSKYPCFDASLFTKVSNSN